jgi:3-hydroxymyristoyl/3-hydroxydecanoyl-(acyl carrier protein) dehydratase
MQPQWNFVIPHDHPSLPGHFPGRPVAPGVVVLDCVMAALLRDRPSARLAGFDYVKFLASVLPGAEVSVTCTEDAAYRLTFVCVVDGQPVLRGRARLRQDE